MKIYQIIAQKRVKNGLAKLDCESLCQWLKKYQIIAQKSVKKGVKKEVLKVSKSVKIAKVRKTPKMTKFRGVKNGQKLEKI